MKRELVIGLAVLFAIQTTTTFAMSPVQAGTVSASGVIDADKSIVTAPRILQPPVVTPMNTFAKQPNLAGGAAVNAAVNASVAATATRVGSGSWMPSASQIAANPIAPAGVVRKLYVRDGQRVTKGAPLARVDATLLRLAVRRNQAAQSQAAAQLLIVNKKIAQLAYRERQLEDAKAKLADAKAAMAAARAKLTAGLAKLSAMQAKLEAQLRKLSRMKIPPMPPAPVPPSPSPTDTPTNTPSPPPIPPIAQLKAKLQAALAQLAAARAKIEAGFQMLAVQSAKLAAAEAHIQKAERAIAKGKVQLAAARRLAVVNAHRTRISAHASRVELTKTLVRAPSDGVVTDLCVDGGELAFSSQPLMTIARTRQVKLLLYLPPDEAQMVRAGRRAEVTIDTFSDRSFPATVSLIAPKVQFAPSNVSTERVYLSDVQAVTLTMENPAGILKIGMPADARISLR